MTIRDVLDSLTNEQRRQLMVAFEHGFPQHVELPNNKFIGVHAEKIKNLKKEQEAGAWSVGTINK